MMDPKRLSKAICQEFETATAKCAGFANKGIVLLIGCCGSGKTTVTSYALGTDFRYNRRTQKLEADNPMEGFVTSAQCADVTKGLMSAEVPNTNGLQLVDNAGTGATEGPIAEVCGAINRSLAVQSARSVRVFLVIKEARGDVGNERGRVLLKDVEHVASMFCRLENLGSVGLIVTSKPRGLSVPGVACEVSKSMYDNFNELLETALAEDEYVDLGAAEAPSHMKTTVAGKRLLEHFAASCDKANKIAEEFKEGEDDSFLGQVCERVAIFPVNVSRSQQRLSLQKWLHNLPAVQNPGEALKYVLLSDAKKDLEQTLSKFFLDCKHSIGERGVSWASDEVLVSKIMDLLSLTQTLEETELMPTAASYRTDLVAQLVRENERVNTMVLEGVRSGNPEKIEGVWPAMVKMDAFRQLCAGVHIPGWMKSAAVMTRGIVVAKESLDRHLPGGCTDARWDFNLALQVKGILSAVQQLEPLGAEVLKSWASALSDHVKGLQKSAGDCKNAASVIHALKCLEEHRKFLPRTLMPILGPYGCQILEGDGLSVAEEAAKDAVQASLANLSGKMVETVLQSGSSAASEQLMQLCRSTELNGILGKDLEDEYVLKPMSTNLAPSQGDIDSLVKTMETSLTDEWHSQLLSINERMAAAGEHGPRLLSSVELKLDGFSAAASKRICKSKDAVTDAIKKLLAQKCLPEVCERSWAALSLNEIPEEIQDTDSDRDVVEEAETAINELELLLPVDTLLKVMRPNLKVQTETVTVALQCIAWTLNKNLSDALKRTTRRARDKAFIPTHSLGAEVIRAMGQLKSLASLAETLAKTLQSLQDHACSTLAEKLSSLVKAANGFVDDVVKKEMEEWAQADTNVSGWRELFTRHLKMANRLQSLDNDQGHVRSAFAALFQKVKMWRDECFKQATEALETGDFLENPASWIRFVQSCVKEGLAFEQSELCEQLGFQAQFRPLVEAQCEICHQEAASTHQNLKLVTWQKLTTLISALQQLQSEDPRVAKCVKSLKESREPLNLALEDDESRFEKALSEGRFAQAAQLLRKVHSRQRHGDRLKEYLLEAMGSASKSIDDDTEVETLISAVKDARRLIQEVDGMEDAEMAAYAKSQRDELEKKLARKSEESEVQLQMALDGRHAPSCALQLRAKMINKSRQNTAREAISEFALKKKQAFAAMNVSDLVQWIMIHERVWKNLPEEFKNQTEDYAELLQEFQKCFDKVFDKDFKSMYAHLDKKQWGEARQTYQDLKSAVDDLLDLEVLKSFRSLKKLQTKLNGSAGRSRCTLAKDDIKKGEFYEAICVVVTSNGEKEEVELLEMIGEQVLKNLRPSTDFAEVHERLTFLDRFREAVGENAPDELVGLSREVNQAYHKAKPQVEQKASAAVSEVLEATAATDLAAMACALSNFKRFEVGLGITEAQQKDVTQAKQEFWRRIKDCCNKVASSIDITNVDVHSLSLSLEPLKGWLDTFQLLSPPKKQALMEKKNPPDLQAWMREVLAEPLRRLLDPSILMNCVDSRRFSDISRRYSASQRLQAVLKTEALDLTVVEQYLLQRKDVGRQALDSANFHQFNSEVKVCKLVSEELVEVPAAFKILADLENDLRERFLNQHLNKLRSAQNIPDAATASQEARKVANSAPDTHEWVTSALEDAFQDLQNKEAFNVQGLATLGMILVQTPLGQTIVAEHPDFFGAVKDMHSNESFRRAGENQNLDEIVGRLTSVSGLDGTEYHELVAALRNHEEQFDQLKNKYLYHGVRPLEDILQEAKTDLDMAVQACNCQDKSAEAVSKLVSHLSVCFTLVKSGKKFLQADVSQQERKLVIPHRGQMLTLFRFLQCHKAVQPDALWKRIFNWVHDKVCGQPENSQQPDNHLAQVLTGEGKCLTLGLLASFLALNGLESDIVCYRKFLIEQDREFMRPFFKFLGVEEKIRYMTFDELCEERLAHIRQASKELIESGKVTTARSQGQFANRACLIDEVDVVFARNFYGNTWDGGFKLTSPQAVGLVSHIFSEVTAGRPIKNIADTDEFQDLLEAYPEEMRGVLTQKAAELVKNVEEWSKPEPILDEKTGRIGYKEKDEVSYDISYSNQTTFAYLSFLQQGKLTPEQVQEQIGIDMLCGRFSFADLPNSYACILGVTGTLMELRSIEGFETVLQNEYGFKHFTITPSIFAGGRFLFNPGEHVQVHAVEEEWGLGLERLVAEHTTRGDSVLVFFKNETQMKKYPGWANMQCLTERTNPKSRKGYIAAATAEGKATLLTRAYGRGIDFQMPEKHRLVVIQTYLSSLVSEEQQIKGRTARHGKSGLFLQVLCAQHLEGKMAFSPEDVNSLRNLKGDQIQSLLKAKQTAKTSSKFFGMAERRNRARHLEAETRKWESLLFGDAETSQKLKRLTTFNQIGDPVHYSVLLDISSSMSGKRKQHMDVAFSKFREQLCEQERQGINTMASVVLFNHTTQVIAPTHVKASELQDIAHRQVGGWTCFHNAFAACRTLISKRSKTQELILFLTDGEAECPERELTALLADHGNRIKCITCVALGAQAGKSVLKNIGAKFEAKNISFNLYDANSEESLVTAFQEAAGCAIHCK